MTESATSRVAKPREETLRKREEILSAAMVVFGNKGYKNGSLAEIAEQVGMTHAGVLHHFGSKDQLLLEVLLYRDRTDVEHIEGQHIPDGLELFNHLVRTARMNEERPGIVQAFAVLSSESVTDNHPAKQFFIERYETLRGEVRAALLAVCDPSDQPSDDEIDYAVNGVIAVMDGLQIQWLLSPDVVKLADSSAFAINAILSSVVSGHTRRIIS
ncbi:TetR/AcrR family transcriptional regulator [Demequina aurantiaca]|uniref:TetR/AcrR family transcriptional regulator n=1 Tax=Demequina aurantiaca TaxID=676200 RepID=UPI000782C918|nr:TetR/AcrR family transcriptional regulator [Demequina aurantiaca]